jgi:hypothetical protein
MNKIDLIIDALSIAQNSVWSKLNEQALAAARELQALAQPKQEHESRITALEIRVANLENPITDHEKQLMAGQRSLLRTAPPRKSEQVITPISPDQYERLCFTCGACTGKPWVGLTEGELIDIQHCNRGFWTNAAKIEQLLKDKNT